MGQEDPLEEGMATTAVFLLWESHGQRNLVGYSPWGLKESDTTERLSTHAQARARAQALLGRRREGENCVYLRGAQAQTSCAIFAQENAYQQQE